MTKKIEEPRTVVISGGSKGLGVDLVEKFLRAGCRVATMSRSQTQQTTDWQQHYPDRFFHESLDLTDRETMTGFVEKVYDRFGDCHVLINNAGMSHSSVLPFCRADDIDKVIDLNIKGTIYLTRLLSRSMLRKNTGKIINISSIVGQSGYRGLSIYSASKAALDGFTRALARELGSRNITVNSISPGFIPTNLSKELTKSQLQQIIKRTPMGRLGTPSDIAALAYFLASPEASFITGQVITVDGGLTC